MNNKQFYLKALKEKDMIIADTCFLMQPALEVFLKNCQKDFETAEKTIYIPPAVHQELARLVASDDLKKSQAAMKASELISHYNNVFSYIHSPFSEEEMLDAFADNAIMVELEANRRKKSTLLLTNDITLSKDALKRNADSHGRFNRIDVCWLDTDGMIKRVHPEHTPQNSQIEEPAVKIQNTEAINSTMPNVKEKKADLFQLGKLLGAGMTGAMLVKYGKPIGKTLIKAVSQVTKWKR